MFLISKLADYIEEELEDAEKYIVQAEEVKDSYPSLASDLCKLSNEEMGHADILHSQIVSLIDNYGKEHGEPPERMLGRYDYIHSRFKKLSQKIKIQQKMFSEK